MLALLGLSTLASLTVSLVLGVRLLRLWGRSRQLPELIFGAAFLSAGVFGYIATIVGSPSTPGLSPTQASNLTLTGIALLSVGVSLNYLFVWKVFRPDSGWAQAFFWVATGVIAITVIPISGYATGSLVTQLNPMTVLGDATRMGAGAWGAFESLRYYTLMRRRLRIGLAEPAVTNRFLLWGIATLATSVIFFATSALVRLYLDPREGALTPELMIIVSLSTLGVATAQWLAFLPPGFYLRWVERRASVAEGTA
jgi:hypothetical protein